jgi:hypothetical protein
MTAVLKVVAEAATDRRVASVNRVRERMVSPDGKVTATNLAGMTVAGVVNAMSRPVKAAAAVSSHAVGVAVDSAASVSVR